MLTTYVQDIYNLLCRKYPNKNIYVIGDHHFFHKNIINYTRANFTSVEEMNDYIIKMHNEVVEKDDIVIFLGDFCFKNNFVKIALEKMNGHKFLILGNHDSSDLIRHGYKLGFEGVFKNLVKINDSYLSHEPLVKGEKDDFQFQLILDEFSRCSNKVNYHGHIHTSDSNISDKHINVTCEALDYKPIMIGKTTNLEKKEHTLFINSDDFDWMINYLNNKYNINPNLFLCDYIYSSILEHLYRYNNKYFVQGSFGLLKKYNFLKKFSDLDISFVYDSKLSKSKNKELLKQAVSEVYESLKEIDGINLSFIKRYSSLCIFEALMVRKDGCFANCNLDANLIPFDCYKDTDFLKLEGISMLERLIEKSNIHISEEFQFPHFKAQFLSLEGDIANLFLQVLFQQGHNEKRSMALRKLKYVCSYVKKEEDIKNLENTFTRFFLRNIAFFHTVNRLDEIEYIKSQIDNISSLLPTNIEYQVYNTFYNMLNNKDSIFLDVYDEIISTPTDNVFDKSKEIVKKLK